MNCKSPFARALSPTSLILLLLSESYSKLDIMGEEPKILQPIGPNSLLPAFIILYLNSTSPAWVNLFGLNAASSHDLYCISKEKALWLLPSSMCLVEMYDPDWWDNFLLCLIRTDNDLTTRYLRRDESVKIGVRIADWRYVISAHCNN